MKRVLRSKADFKSTTLRNQLTSLVIYETLTTTRAKAKELEAYANHFFNKTRYADLPAKKLAHQTLLTSVAVKKVFEEIAPRYRNNETTFIRSLKVSPRSGDAAAMTMLSLIKPLVVDTKLIESSKADAVKATPNMKEVKAKTTGKATVTVRNKKNA